MFNKAVGLLRELQNNKNSGKDLNIVGDIRVQDNAGISFNLRIDNDLKPLLKMLDEKIAEISARSSAKLYLTVS